MTGLATFIAAAESQIGVAYVWGGTTPGVGFDCSGLTQWAAGKAGLVLPRTAQDQYNATQAISTLTAPPAGALVFFGAGPAAIDHVGISLGSWWMVDAPNTGAKIRVESFAPGSGWDNLVGATDAFTGSASPSALGISTLDASSSTTQTASFLTSTMRTMTSVTITGLLLTAGVGLAGVGIYRGSQARTKGPTP